MNEKRSSRIEAKIFHSQSFGRHRLACVGMLTLALFRFHQVVWSGCPGNSQAPTERGHSCPRPATIHIRGPLVDEPQQRSGSTVSLLIAARELRIDEDPTWQPANGELFEIRVFTRKSKAQSGRIIDQLPDLTTPIACGARIEAETRSRVSRARQSGRVLHRGRTWRFRRPPSGTLRAYWKNVRILEAPPSGTPAHLLRSFKVQLLNTFRQRFSDPVYRLAAGATLGDRGPVREGTYRHRPIARLFAHAGLGHVLAVSGLHVGTLAGAALWIMTRLHVPRRRRIFPLAIVLGLFCFLTGGRPATARAVIMTLVGVHSYAQRRAGLHVSARRGISTAALILLLYEPRLLFDMGSQLSFMAVFSLIGLTRPIQTILDHRLRSFGWARLPHAFRSLIAIQLGMVLPFSSLYFGRFSVAGVFVNLVAIPLIGVFVPAALLTGLLYLIPFVGPLLAWLPGCCAELVGRAFFAIAHLSASLFPYPDIPRIPWFLLLPYYALLLLFIRPFHRALPAQKSLPDSPVAQAWHGYPIRAVVAPLRAEQISAPRPSAARLSKRPFLRISVSPAQNPGGPHCVRLPADTAPTAFKTEQPKYSTDTAHNRIRTKETGTANEREQTQTLSSIRVHLRSFAVQIFLGKKPTTRQEP